MLGNALFFWGNSDGDSDVLSLLSSFEQQVVAPVELLEVKSPCCSSLSSCIAPGHGASRLGSSIPPEILYFNFFPHTSKVLRT